MKYRQKKDGWCGPAALEYAMHMQGKDVSQEELAKKLDTSVSEGTDNEDMVRVAKSYGFPVRIIEGKTPEETLKILDAVRGESKFPIVDYLQGNNLERDGHYSVFLGSNHDTIRIYNVSSGKAEMHKTKDFISKWKDIGTDAHKTPYKRWVMILNKLF